jgi:hypothetical protein
VLAVEVDYPSGEAAIGVEADKPVPKEEIRAALKLHGYHGEFVEPTPQ